MNECVAYFIIYCKLTQTYNWAQWYGNGVISASGTASACMLCEYGRLCVCVFHYILDGHYLSLGESWPVPHMGSIELCAGVQTRKGNRHLLPVYTQEYRWESQCGNVISCYHLTAAVMPSTGINWVVKTNGQLPQAPYRIANYTNTDVLARCSTLLYFRLAFLSYSTRSYSIFRTSQIAASMRGFLIVVSKILQSIGRSIGPNALEHRAGLLVRSKMLSSRKCEQIDIY